jgi:hypothetical protein
MTAPEDLFFDAAREPLPGVPEPEPMRDVRAAPGPVATRAGPTVAGRAWRAAWRTALPLAFQARHVLAARARALVVGTDRWQLVDLHDGRSLGELALSRGDDVLLEADADRFLHVERLATLASRRLDDGHAAWRLFPAGGEAYATRLIASRGPRVALACVQRPVAASHTEPSVPELAMVELHDVGDPAVVDEDQVVVGATRRALVLRRAPETLFAAHGDALVLASRDRVHVLDLAQGLRVRRGLVAPEPFTPRALAADEQGRLLLVVDVTGTPVLWGLTPGGERFLQAPLPAGLGPGVAPPLVGPEGRVYVHDGRLLLAHEPDGRLAWGRLARALAGAVVAACGTVVATLDGVVMALDVVGNLRELARADEPFVTAPALLADGRLLVAGARSLHAFAPA